MGRRCKVLLLAFACEPGAGSEPGIGWNWACQIARRHDVTVLTDEDHRAPIEAELRSSGSIEGLQFKYFGPGARRWPWFKRVGHAGYCLWWMRKVRPFVAELHRSEKFEVMHHVTYGACRYPTAAWGHDVPVVWGPVGGMEDTPWLFIPWRHPKLAFGEVIRNLSNAAMRLPFGMLRSGGRQSALVVSSTKETKAAFQGVGIDSVLLPAIGIEAGAVMAQAKPRCDGGLRLLFVGRLLAWKGLEFAIRAVALAGRDTQLTVIGNGPFLNPAREIARRLNVADRIELRGALRREETLRAFSDHHAFLFPSLHDSGGFAVLEAMANGLPVICLDCGGPAEAVEDGCGVRVAVTDPRGTVADLSAAIQRYDLDRHLLEVEGENAKESVLRRYEWNRKGRAMVDLYEHIPGLSGGD